MRTSKLLLFATFLGFPIFLQAQAPPSPAPKNFISNPGFEVGSQRSNLWYGVDGSKFLTGEREALPVLTASGVIADTAMPVSISIADLNSDGLPDIAAMDVLGYFRVYFNSGTKEEPKFTIGELSTIFLSRVNPKDPTLQGVGVKHARRGERIYLTDIMHSGKKDLIIGNYLGEIMLVPNTGTPLRPDFRQPAKIEQVLIPTMKDSLKKWGNVFAPATWDWNGDGKEDLLVGEGSYSANSIHLLINQGAGKPVFNENNRSVLAYGMGLEQLTPSVVDYNGDGLMDLLVSERSGKVAIYLNDGKPWKAGETLAFDSFIPAGGGASAAVGTANKDPMTAANAPGLLSVGGIATIATGDMNGDGLFDLIFGKSNGKIAISLNAGTKTEPKFGAPVDIKSDAPTPPFTLPAGWTCDFGLERGNFFGFFSLVKGTEDSQASPVEGRSVLKAGYVPSKNKNIPVPSQYTPAFESYRAGDISLFTPEASAAAPANFFSMVQRGRTPLQIGKPYVFSMKVKGSRFTDAAVRIRSEVVKKLSEAKIERGERGSAKITENELREEKNEIIKFSAGTAWTEVKREFTIKLNNKNLKDVTQVTNWEIAVNFTLSPGAGVIYFDDMKLMEK